MNRPCYTDGEVRPPLRRKVPHHETGELTRTPWIPADQLQQQENTAHQQSNVRHHQKKAQKQVKPSDQNPSLAVSGQHSGTRHHSACYPTPMHPAASYSGPTNPPTPYPGPIHLDPPPYVPCPPTFPYSAYKYPDPQTANTQYPALPYLSASYPPFQPSGFQNPGTPMTASSNVRDQAPASDINRRAPNENQAIPISRMDPMLFQDTIHAANHNSTGIQTSSFNSATPDNENVPINSGVSSMHRTGSSRTAPPINQSKPNQKPKSAEAKESTTARMKRKRDDIHDEDEENDGDHDDETEEPGTLVGRNLRPLAKKPFKPEFKPKPKPKPPPKSYG